MTAEKSAEAFRTISEVADDLQVPQHVLRFWEGRFPQIKPLKRGGGRRYYRPADVDLLAKIRDMLYKQGLTIKDVQAALKSGAIVVPRENLEFEMHLGPEDSALSPESEAEPEYPAEDDEFEAPVVVEEIITVHESAEIPLPDELPLMPPIQPTPVSTHVVAPVPPLPHLTESTRNELTTILNELEQLRFLLRAKN